ncbi:MAG: hypothetical protein U9Q92_01945 [archaeon]|nr:hypothetical protein [archaeon]
MKTIYLALMTVLLFAIMIGFTLQNQEKEPDMPTPEEEQTKNVVLNQGLPVEIHEKEKNIPEPVKEIKNESNKEELPIEINESDEEQEEEPTEDPEKEPAAKKLIMFHNGRGPMCLEQLKFLEGVKPQYPSLIIEEHLTTEQGTRELLNQLKSEYDKSEGISDNFGYLPITFINDYAYSGFNSEVKEKLEKDIEEIS